MSNTVTGFIEKIFVKEGSGKRGLWALDNILLVDAEGKDLGWYGLGFRDHAAVPPSLEEGDYITVEWEQDGDYKNIVKGSGKRHKDAPSRTGKAKPVASNAASKATDSDLFGTIGGYNTEDDIRRMTYTAASNRAVAAVGLLLEHKALPMSSAATKAGEAKRFDTILAQIDKLTVEYYFDQATTRKLAVVADAGNVTVRADCELPGDPAESIEDTQKVPETPSDDTPPPESTSESF